MLTEWKEFRSPDFDEIKSQLVSPVIFDGRNQYNAFNIDKDGFEYFQIGKIIHLTIHAYTFIHPRFNVLQIQC